VASDGYILMLYHGPGLAPERSEFEDQARAEKAFTDAKTAAILWEARTATTGLGWVKLKEKDAPPAAPTPPLVAPKQP
jgi:hypothetical protein